MAAMGHRMRSLWLLAAIVATGCGSGSNTTSGVDPVADAKRALAEGDQRVVGYMGFALVVPGTPPGFEQWTYAPGVKIVHHVTDTSPRKEIERANDYATRYNQVILGGGNGGGGTDER